MPFSGAVVWWIDLSGFFGYAEANRSVTSFGQLIIMIPYENQLLACLGPSWKLFHRPIKKGVEDWNKEHKSAAYTLTLNQNMPLNRVRPVFSDAPFGN